MDDREFIMTSNPYFKDKDYYITQCELMKVIILNLATPTILQTRPNAGAIKFNGFKICENKLGLYYDIILQFTVDDEKIILQSTLTRDNFKNAKVLDTLFKGA